MEAKKTEKITLDTRIKKFKHIEHPSIIREWKPGNPFWPDYQQWYSYHATSGMYEPIIEGHGK